MLKKGNAVYREINKRRIILERRMPFSKDVYEFLDEMNITDMIFTSMQLDGGNMKRETIIGILKGNFYTDVSLMEHVKVQRYKELFLELNAMCRMKTEISEAVFSHVYKIINDEEMSLREDNPVVYEWEYNPPHPREIKSMMNVLINWIGRDGRAYDNANPLETPDLRESPSDFVLRAAYLHCRIVEIYPFGDKSAELARIMMYYYLMLKGYPVFRLDMNEQQYNTAIGEYLKNGNIGMFYEEIGRALFKKTELMMQITAAK